MGSGSVGVQCCLLLSTTVHHVPPSFASLSSIFISSPRILSCRPIIPCTVSLFLSLPPSFQTSPPSPAYCPSFCVCVHTGLQCSFLSIICCTMFFLHRTQGRISL